MSNILVLDSGHNEFVAGKETKDKSFREWEFNNYIQNQVKKRMEEHKVKVFLTNPNPEKKGEIGLDTRCDIANNIYKNNKSSNIMFLSIHANAADNTSARGIETYIATNSSIKSKEFANTINSEVYNAIKKIDNNFKNRGVKTYNYYVIKNTLSPCCLIEYGFFSNLDDLKLLKNNRADFVESTVKALCLYYNIKYQETGDKGLIEPLNPSETYYRVIVGSYKDKNNAEKLMKELSDKGYKTFMEIYLKK